MFKSPVLLKTHGDFSFYQLLESTQKQLSCKIWCGPNVKIDRVKKSCEIQAGSQELPVVGEFVLPYPSFSKNQHIFT